MAVFVTSCNVQRFDILKHFEDEKQVYWKQITKCTVGDTIYIYVGRPYSRLMFKCEVIEKNLDGVECDYLTTSIGKPTKYMRIGFLEKIHADIGLDDLLSNGLKTVQCAMLASPALVSYIEKRMV